MKYSNVFGKTVKDAQKDMELESLRLLYRGGFFRESVAGRYYVLPMGLRVREKVVNIIKEEMRASGSQEMLTPALHPMHLWEETNRDEAANFELMQVTDRRGARFALGGTAEEMVADLVRKFNISYKDLPFNLYQLSMKFRDELRARGGLLRTREFMMKDAYSFHVDEADFETEYENMADTYTRIFNRLGLFTVKVPADGGYIGGEYCHEYVVDSEVGESLYFYTEEGDYIAHEDIAEFTLEEVNPDEQMLDMEEVDQPEWVKTMEDNVKHYGKDARYFLKNVVYKTHKGDIVIAVIRGDLSVNKIKLAKLLGVDVELTEATEEDLESIGTQSGWVHSWGHEYVGEYETEEKPKVIYVADESLNTVKNFIGGHKTENTDTVNVNYGRDFKHEIEGDIATAQSGMLAPDGSGLRLKSRVGIEVGNIFQLGYHYSSKMKDLVFVSQEGKPENLYMGCYGIGIGRTIAAIAEVHRDETGLVWPISVAPYQVHLMHIGKDDMYTHAENLYIALSEAGVEVLWDDRDTSAGLKFGDADLLGVPIRLVVSKRSIENGGVEIKLRSSDKVDYIAADATAVVESVNAKKRELFESLEVN